MKNHFSAFFIGFPDLFVGSIAFHTPPSRHAKVHAGPAKFEFGDDEFVDWVDGQVGNGKVEKARRKMKKDH